MTKWIYGKQQVLSCMKAGTKISKVYCTPNAIEIIEACKKFKIDYKLRPVNDISKIIGDIKHQNVIALVDEIKFYKLQDIIAEKPLNNTYLILDRIQDVHNYGSILRSAEIFQVDAVIVLNREQAPITPAVYKTSAGAINYLKIVEVNNLQNAIKFLKEYNFWIYASGFCAGAKKLSDITFQKNENIAIILGNEGSGISKNILNNADFILMIDMFGKTECLNVSVTCGIFLYHIKMIKNKDT